MTKFVEMVNYMRQAQEEFRICKCEGCKSNKIETEKAVDAMLSVYTRLLTQGVLTDDIQAINFKTNILYFPNPSHN